MKSFLASGSKPLPDQRQVWGSVSPDYKDTITKEDGHIMQATLKAFLSLAVDLLSDRDSAMVLDVACGPGEPALAIASALPCLSVVATDFSEGMLATAKARGAEIGLKNVRFELADAMDLRAFSTDSIDLITMSFGLMFVPDPVKALQEFWRVLKPGGVLALGVWHAEPEQMQFAAFSGAVAAKLKVDKVVSGNSLAGEGVEALKQKLRQVGFTLEEARDINNALRIREPEFFKMMCGTVMMKPFLDGKRAAGEDGALQNAHKVIHEVGIEDGYLQDGCYVFDPNVSHFVVGKKPPS